jgi:GWxTD domain-containing protein
MIKKTPILLLLLVLAACSGSKKISLINLAGEYNNWNFSHISSAVYNKNEGFADVFIEFNLNDLIYKEDDEVPGNRAHYSIHYDLFYGFEDKKSIDSATLFYYDSLYFGVDKMMLHHFSLAYPEEGNYVLQITLEDINGGQAMEHFIEIENETGLGKNDVMLTDPDSVPLLTSFMDSVSEFIVRINDPGISELYVRYYNREFPIAYPPFWNEEPDNYVYKPDSIFKITLHDGFTDILSFPGRGIYQFQADTATRMGKAVFRFYDGFPEVSDPLRLLEPLRYITTEEEYDEMRNSDNIKLAIDRFWLDNAGNPARGRNMIQKYYSRVADANKYFSSYLEGWKTDRGLIYIIFGPPKIVYRANFFEEWIYGEAGNSNSIKFQFFQVDNPFTDNDFSLYRLPGYKERWYSVVSSWRR